MVAASLVMAGCGGAGDEPSSPKASAGRGKTVELNLGYFPNITHAAALVGVENGLFADSLGPLVKLETSTFNAGPAAIEAMFSRAVDATYIGPNPAVNAFVKSGGEAIRIISGATSGGAFLVVKPEIQSARDLEGKKLASPQLGNTQDVALRGWLKSQGLTTDAQGGGDVSVLPQENAQTLESFRQGLIDGAWVPEPWATRLIVEGKGKVLVDERELWPEGRYVTTHLIVRTKYLREHPDVVAGLLRGHVAATDFVNSKTTEAQAVVNGAIEKVTGKRLGDEIIEKAWENLTFTTDPVASSLFRSAEEATELGLLQEADLDGIYDVAPINRVLAALGKEKVSADSQI